MFQSFFYLSLHRVSVSQPTDRDPLTGRGRFETGRGHIGQTFWKILKNK